MLRGFPSWADIVLHFHFDTWLLSNFEAGYLTISYLSLFNSFFYMLSNFFLNLHHCDLQSYS